MGEPQRSQPVDPKKRTGMKTAIIVIAVVEAVAMIPLVLHLASR